MRDAYLSIGDQGRHYLFILYWLGFDQTAVDVPARSREQAGESSYTFTKLVRHAVDGMFFQTTVLLRWIVYFGFLVALAGVLLAGVFVLILAFGDPYSGLDEPRRPDPHHRRLHHHEHRRNGAVHREDIRPGEGPAAVRGRRAARARTRAESDE